MVKRLLYFAFFSTCFIFSTNAQSTISDFAAVKLLDNSSLERAIYSNRNKGQSAFHHIKVLYTINTTSIKISAEESSKFQSELRKVDGVIDCFFDMEKSLLLVKTEKEIKYVRIEQIKEILRQYTTLQIENYKEELYTID